MARVSIYKRFVDAVFMDVNMEGKSNHSEHGIIPKQESEDSEDPDQCVSDFPLPNINTRDENETTATEDRPTGFVTCRENESALTKKSIHSEPKLISNNSKFVPVGIQRESLMPKNEDSPLKTNGIVNKTVNLSRHRGRWLAKCAIFCDVCSVHFKNTCQLQKHKKAFTISQFECKKCCIWFGSYVSLMYHKRSRICKQRHSDLFKVYCYFCNEHFGKKKILQSHLFHLHGDLIFRGENGTGERRGTELKGYTNDLPKNTASVTPKISNGLIDTPTRKLKDSDDTPVSTLHRSYIVDSKNSNTLTSTPLKRLRNTPCQQSKTLNSSCRSPSRNDTPKEKMRHATLTDVISSDKNVVKSEIISPKKVNDTEPDVISHDASRLVRDSEVSTFVRHTNSDTPPRKTPFVRIHVDQSFMMKLLKGGINTQANSPVDRSDSSYNLRSPRKTVPLYKLNSEGSSFNGKAFRRYEKSWIRHKNLKMKFNCKECTIPLKRCDESVILASRKSNELGKEVDSKKENKGSVKADKVRRKGTLPSIKPIKSVDAVDRKKIHECRVCSKRFILKETMNEHMELSHTIYASSICNARYTTMDKLVNHYMRQHFVLKRKECCVCLETLKTSALAKQHMISHCVKTIRSKKSTMPVDVEINCSGIKKLNKCRGCFKRFWLRSCLVEHEKVCRYANAQKDTQRTSNIERTCSSFLDDQDNMKANLIDIEKIVEPSVQESPNEYLLQAVEFRSELSAIETQTSNNSTPCIPVAADEFLSSSYAVKSNKRLINGVACATGYQVNMSDAVKFPCTICGKKFQTFQNLCLHERTFCKPANNLCNICRTGFPTKRLLQLHMLATHTPACMENYKFFCKFCKQGFLKKMNCQIHERHFHLSQVYQLLKVDSPWNVSPSCSTCNLTFESYKRFIEHNMYYYKGHVFMCLVCNAPFQGIYLLHSHNKLVHYPKSILQLCIYKCDVCGEGFDHESHYHAHKMHVHGPDTSLVTPSWSAMQEHNYALVANDLPAREEALKISAKMYTCSVCNLNFTNQEDLSAHEIEYSTDGDLQCDKCSRKCCTSSILAKHQSLNHTGCDINSIYKCRFCGEVSTTSTSMLCHEKHFHTNRTNQLKNATDQKLDRPIDKFAIENHNFTCSTCELKFANEISLKNHLLEYSNIGLYSCTICQRKFTDLYLLAMHKVKHSRTHNTMLEHRCPICNEGFGNSSDVRTHVLHLHRYESFNDKVSDEPDTAKVADSVPTDENSLASKLMEIFRRYIPAAANSFQQENRVQCSKCDMTFKSRKGLKKHKARYVNYGDYNCTICGRRFPWQAMLKQHVRKHSNSTKRLLKYNCPQCEEKFRSTVSVYSHVIHIHGRDKLTVPPDSVANKTDSGTVDVGPSTFTENRESPAQKLLDNKDWDGSERLMEHLIESPSKRSEILAVADPRAPVTNDQLVPGCIVKKESMPATMENHDPVSEERMFYYTCAECNSKHPTLREFRAHFKTMHKKDKQGGKLSTEVNAKNEANCVIRDRNSVDREKVCDRTPGPRKITDTSSNDKTESEECLPVTNDEKQDSDAVEVIWETKRNAAEVIVIDDTDVQVIQDDYQSTVSEQTGKDLLSDAMPIKDTVPKLKVKSFAQIRNNPLF